MKRGFTIIELLVVVCIIGLLTSVILVATSSARKKSRDDKRKADIQSVALGLEMYYAKNKSYPPIANFAGSWSQLAGGMRTFVPSWPSDPSPTGLVYGQNYVYGSDGNTYILDAVLEIHQDNPPDFLPSDPCSDPTVFTSNTDPGVAGCFQTTTYNNFGVTHYRIGSR